MFRKNNKRINICIKKIKHQDILGKSMLLISYVVFGTLAVYLLLNILKDFGAPSEVITDTSGIGEVVVAVVAAIMIIYQLELEREVEHRENQIQEANFVVQYNQIFLENESMQKVQNNLTADYMGVCPLKSCWDDNMLQEYINYLVYLEGFVPLVAENIINIENIDNLFAYRYFIAVNNPVLQEKSLGCYDYFYKGCFTIYKKWRNYRINTYCAEPYNERYREVVPMAEYELDQLECYRKYAEIDVVGYRTGVEVCRQLKVNENIAMNKLYEIAKLIYDTDPYIYPAMFENRIDAIEMIVHLILTNRDMMFSLDNFFVIENDEEVKGVILWKKGPVKWSKELFKEIAAKNHVSISKHLDFVCEKYFDSYNDEDLENRISLINVCVNHHYRGKGLGKKLLQEFLKKHRNEDMELCVLKDNKNAVKLYKSVGFEIVQERNGFSIDLNKPECLDMVRSGR